ncbi:hypothetical protein [Streptococcus gallolyticus]|uniref:Uncharacterized protein n=1 Tax=Streptococcus gallolyticus TaxID=315405 RepID=A0A1H9VAE4_9STRE|nr:hypothetical protein [Streptococcus gallolyticus]SES18645.1 hypothetical protein SAMN04487840_12124 [Streptococcus gallolyticus]
MIWLAWALYNLGAIAACAFISIYFKSAWWMLLALLFVKDLKLKKKGDANGSDE